MVEQVTDAYNMVKGKVQRKEHCEDCKGRGVSGTSH